MFTGYLNILREGIVDEGSNLALQGARLSHLFLGGSLSSNDYFVARLDRFANAYNMDVSSLPDDHGWTAAARGGVFMGLGLGCEVPSVSSSCPASIGIAVARNETVDSLEGIKHGPHRVVMLIDRGDLIEHDRLVERTTRLVRMASKVDGEYDLAGQLEIVASKPVWNSEGPYRDEDFESKFMDLIPLRQLPRRRLTATPLKHWWYF